MKNVALNILRLTDVSKFQRLRASSKTKENSTVICLEITSHKIQKRHSTLRRENSRQKCTVSADSRTSRPKICTNRAPNRFATQINRLLSLRDELLSKVISKQSEFRFAVAEQTLADNRSINK